MFGRANKRKKKFIAPVLRVNEAEVPISSGVAWFVIGGCVFVYAHVSQAPGGQGAPWPKVIQSLQDASRFLCSSKCALSSLQAEGFLSQAPRG